MKQQSLAALVAALLVVGPAGCSQSEPSNMMEGTDKSKLAEYEALIEAEANAMSEQGIENPE